MEIKVYDMDGVEQFIGEADFFLEKCDYDYEVEEALDKLETRDTGNTVEIIWEYERYVIEKMEKELIY